MWTMTLMPTGMPNLDRVLGGGIPVYSLNILAGQPGTGKTILAQQILFNFIRSHKDAKALYLTTLSEPTVKVVRYMQHFTFFEADAFGERVLYQDIGPFIRKHPLPEVTDQILGLVEEHGAEVLVIDSFKAIRDLVRDLNEFRRFCYDLSTYLASVRCTTLLVGEYDRPDIAEGAEFAVADGILYLGIARQEGEQRRFLQVYKLRGQAAEMAPFPFTIVPEGIRILSPSLTLRRRETALETEAERVTSGIPGLDDLLRGGLPRGRSFVLSGVSGSGKTTFALQFLVYGAQQGEKGLLFSFEETPDRLRYMARGFGWDLVELEKKGLLHMVFIPQTDIRVEEHLEQIARQVEAFQPSRFTIDSFSVFLHKVKDPAIQREKTFQLATLVQRTGGVGLFISDIPAEEPGRLSRFGVEETVMDGTIVLSTEMVGLSRKRYIEVYKMRAVDHIPGRYRMEITKQGLEVFYLASLAGSAPPATSLLTFQPLKAMVPEGVYHDATWLVQGEPGIGKTTLAQQFAVAGLREGESVLYITTDAPVYLLRSQMEAFGIVVEPYLQSGHLRLLGTHGVSGEICLDLIDLERFLYEIGQHLRTIPKPCRIITDSLTPFATQYPMDELAAFVERKNRWLRQPDVALLDSLLPKTLHENVVQGLLNSYDVVLNMYTPNWGEMGQIGQGFRVLQVCKARGVRVDTRPYPYAIRPGEGVIVQEGFYGGK